MADPASRTLPDGSIKVEDGSEVVSSRPVVASESSRAALRKLLEHFLHCLQRKDSENFFAHPVNTATAPGNVQQFNIKHDKGRNVFILDSVPVNAYVILG